MNSEYDKIIKLKTDIIPQLLIFSKRLFKITKIPEYYRIKNYGIATSKNKIKKVFLYNTWHPNAIEDCEYNNMDIVISEIPPKELTFCLPDYIKNKEFSDETRFSIERLLSIINYDSCYHRNLNIEYQEITTNLGTAL